MYVKQKKLKNPFYKLFFNFFVYNFFKTYAGLGEDENSIFFG